MMQNAQNVPAPNSAGEGRQRWFAGLPPRRLFKRQIADRRGADAERAQACRLRVVHALRARRTLSLRAHALPPRARAAHACPPPAPPPPQSLQCASDFARRPFHASSDALIGRLAKQASECVHKWVGAASASTSLPSSLPASVCGFGRVGAQCLAAGPSRRTLRWLVVVAPPRISWLPRVARSNALLHAPGPDPR